MRMIDADKMVTNELVAFILAQAKTNNAANRDINSIVHEKIQRLIADTPTVEDAVQVVHCKECRYRSSYGECCRFDDWSPHETGERDYCSWGLKKQEEQE